MSAKSEIMLSVGVLAYNHEKYIAQALNSILMQKVDFEYEIIIGEDCSTDNTRNILLDFSAAYPDRIKLILHDKNLGMNANADSVRFSCKGCYMAFLDGDNYWTDENKLQKQIDFLESNKLYIGYAHKVYVVDENGEPSKARYHASHCPDEIYTLSHAEKGMLPGQSGTYVFRNIFRDFTPAQRELYRNCDSVGDAKLALTLALNAPVYCSNEAMSAFRFVTDGASFSSWSYNSNLSLKYCHWLFERIRFARECYGKDISYRYMLLDIGYHAFVELLRHPSGENLRIYRQTVTYQKGKLRLCLCLHIAKKCFLLPIRILKRKLNFRKNRNAPQIA